MEQVPLIPQINSKACPDTSHVIREEFQCLLKEKSFPEDVAQNLQKYKIDSRELKKCGADIQEVYERTKISLSDIGCVESNLMHSQANYVVTTDKTPLPDITLLKMPRIYPSINKGLINKYSLVHADDLLPHITERVLDFRYGEEIRCKKPCPVTQDRYEEAEEFPFVKTSMIHIKNQTDEYKLLKKYITSSELKMGQYLDKLVFRAEPKNVVFNNYEKDIKYEKHLNLRNITTKTQSIVLPELSKNSKFTITVLNTTYKIAPGMCCNILVEFQTDTLTDVFEELVIKVPFSKDFKVNLKSFRHVPSLKGFARSYDNMDLTEVFIPDMINTALNYTIDCGACLIGYCSEINFLLKNFGGDGKFFCVSEEDWVFGQLKDITEDLHLHLGDFHIYPAHFQLQRDDMINIEIIFHPFTEGFHVQKFYILCNNNTMEEIDVIGDCYFFDTQMIRVILPEIPHYFPESEGNVDTGIHLGNTTKDIPVVKKIIVKNKSSIKIRYGWVKKPTDVSNRRCKIMNLEDDWLDIIPQEGVLKPNTTVEFSVVACLRTKKCGLYSSTLSLLVYDIPEISLVEGTIFNFEEEYYPDSDEDSPKLLSILISNVEVQINNIEFPVFLIPQEAKFPVLKYKSQNCINSIKVFNDSSLPVVCEWVAPDCFCEKCLVVFDPGHFRVQPKSYVQCQLSLQPFGYQDINENLTLVLNDGYAVKDFKLKAEIEKPVVTVLESVLDFGMVIKRRHYTKTITVYNMHETQLLWYVIEYAFNWDTKEMMQKGDCNLSSNSGELCHKGSYSFVTYTLDTEECGKWLSILAFYSLFDNQQIVSTHVMVLADIRAPEIYITNEMREVGILTIPEELFLDKPSTYTVFLNNDAIVEGEYTWGEPYGDQKNNLKVSFVSNNGKVYPNSRKVIELTIKPCEIGVVDFFFIPCIVESYEQPLVLKILCSVKGLQVVFSIPYGDRFIDISWPSYDEKSNESWKIDWTNINPEDLPTPETRLTLDSLENQSHAVFNAGCQTNKKIVKGIEINIDDIICGGEEEESYIWEIPDSTATPPVLPTDQTNTKTSSVSTLKSHFTSNDSILDYIIDFQNVPCRQRVRKQIFIQNVTDISTNFTVKVKNFQAVEVPPKKGVEKILIELNWKTEDEFVEKLTKYGIVVIPKPCEGVIPPHDSVTIDLWVYAETWGIYLEEVGITVSDMPVFSVSMIIHVTGMPVEYPIALNTNMVQPILRFGSFSIHTEPQIRTLKVTNNSMIPFNIVWHILNTHLVPKYPTVPFNILFDLYGLPDEENQIENTFCSMKLIKYIGEESKRNRQAFEVEPVELYLNPKETRKLTITLNSRNVQFHGNNFVELDSILIGHIYIDEMHRSYPRIFIRPVDTKLQPTKVQLLGRMEKPPFDFEHIHGDTSVTMSINDAIKINNRQKILRLVFKSTNTANIRINMKVSEPFEILKFKNIRCVCDNNVKCKCVVHFGECVEVFVKCHITNYLVMNLADVMYNDAQHYLKETKFLNNNIVQIIRHLNVYQQCQPIQNLLLDMTIIFPCLTVFPCELNFGKVYIGCTKLLTILITNKNNSDAWWGSVLSNSPDVFCLDPPGGVIPPVSTEEESLYVTVCFTPNDTVMMEETVSIITCLPQYSLQVRLMGEGTIDEKYYVPPLNQNYAAKRCKC